MLRLKVIENAPVTNSAPKRAIRTFKKLYIAVIGVVAHFRKRAVDLVLLSVNEPAQLPAWRG